MTWRIEFEARALKELKKLDRSEARRITAYMRKRVAIRDDPRTLATQLIGQWGDYWRFRVGDYRVICRLEDQEFIVLVVRVGHRREVYR